MFSFLKRFMPKPKPDECVQFLMGLASRETPEIKLSRYVYTFKAELVFPSVSVELKYNVIRREYQLDVRENQTYQQLYGYYCTWGPPTRQQVDYILDAFGIRPKLDAMIESYKEQRRQDALRTEATRKMFLDQGRDL